MKHRFIEDVSLNTTLEVFSEETGQNIRGGGNFDCFIPSCKGSQKSLSIDDRKGRVLLHCFRCNGGWTPYSFLQERGYKHLEILKKLDVEITEEEKTFANAKEQLIAFCQQKYPTYKLVYQNIFTFAIDDLRNAIGMISATYHKNITGYCDEAFNFVFKNHYKCKLIPINSGAPIYTFLYFDDENQIQICNSEFEKIPYNFDKFLKWVKNPSDERVLIITEGEKDCDTLMEKLNYGNRFLAISLKTGSRELHQVLFQMVFQKTNKVYFVGDNDLAGIEYRHRVFLLAKPYVKHFYVLRLYGMASLGIGADITDWYEHAVLTGQKRKEIQDIFYETLFAHPAHDFQVSEHFESVACVELKKNKKIVVDDSWVNLRSFFEFYGVILRKDALSERVTGDLRSLWVIRDDSPFGINVHRLQMLVGKCGWKIDRKKLEEALIDYLRENQYVWMLQAICKTPMVQSYKKITFHEEFGTYYVPPLMEFLLNSIVFKSSDEKDVALQKIMIYKALLTLPYMLENSATKQRRIKADLRFVGGKAVGKSTFCRDLMTLCDKDEIHQCFMEMGTLDLKNKDQRRLSFSSPCLILDEGVMYGTNAERKAYLEESVYYYTPKFTDIKASIIRRNIILSSSNEMQHSTDKFNERRLYQVDVIKLPYLSRLTKKEYQERANFWKNHGIEQENFYNDQLGAEKVFRFPSLEFWRQMYHVYKYYEESNINLETLTVLNCNEMRYYDEYMSDKISVKEDTREMEDMFGEENWRNASRENNMVQYITAKNMKMLLWMSAVNRKVISMSEFVKNYKAFVDGYGKNRELEANKTICVNGKSVKFYIVPLFSEYFIKGLERLHGYELRQLFRMPSLLYKSCTKKESMENDVSLYQMLFSYKEECVDTTIST